MRVNFFLNLKMNSCLRCKIIFMRILLCMLLFSIDLFSLDNSNSLCKKTYIFSNDPIDVVIPSVDKDLRTLELCIKGIRENCKNLGRIFVVSNKKLTEEAIWIDESKFPFTKLDIALELFKSREKSLEYLKTPNNRLGWVFQQLLKLYSSFIIEGISSNVLILDSDTIFLNPVEFIQESGAAFFNIGDQYHAPYFTHMKRLLPSLSKVYENYSGIVHHMLFQRSVLSDLRSKIELHHQTPMWKAFLKCVDVEELPGSCFSEYEIYFNFAFSESDQFLIRPLLWMDLSFNRFSPSFKERGYSYVSLHTWLPFS
jgi:hypothetical protein